MALPAHTRHVHTGSIATTLLPGAAEVTHALRRGRDLGTTSYDPNIRPTIMGTPDQVRPRVEELVAVSDVVKCSEDDLAWLYPALSASEVMARWCTLGAALTVVTMGGAGVTWRLASSPQEGQAASRTAAGEVVDTVGADIAAAGSGDPTTVEVHTSGATFGRLVNGSNPTVTIVTLSCLHWVVQGYWRR